MIIHTGIQPVLIPPPAGDLHEMCLLTLAQKKFLYALL